MSPRSRWRLPRRLRCRTAEDQAPRDPVEGTPEVLGLAEENRGILAQAEENQEALDQEAASLVGPGREVVIQVALGLAEGRPEIQGQEEESPEVRGQEESQGLAQHLATLGQVGSRGRAQPQVLLDLETLAVPVREESPAPVQRQSLLSQEENRGPDQRRELQGREGSLNLGRRPGSPAVPETLGGQAAQDPESPVDLGLAKLVAPDPETLEIPVVLGSPVVLESLADLESLAAQDPETLVVPGPGSLAGLAEETRAAERHMYPGCRVCCWDTARVDRS